MRLHLPFETRVLKLALARDLQQFVVGNRAPQEKRQPGSEFEIAHCDGSSLERLPPDRAPFERRIWGLPKFALMPSQFQHRTCPTSGPIRKIPAAAPDRPQSRIRGRPAGKGSPEFFARTASPHSRCPGGTGRSARRLGVSPGPVGLKGPVSVTVSKCGWPAGSNVSFEERINDCSRSVF